MGSTQAQEFAGLVKEGLELERALTWHLQYNHYPPVPLSFVEICKKAIDLANAGQWETLIGLPQGCSYKGRSKAPVSAVVQQHHLESFINSEEE